MILAHAGLNPYFFIPLMFVPKTESLLNDVSTLKVPSKNCCRQHSYSFYHKKIGLDISCESSAWQMIHMKCQYLFSLKNKKKYSRTSMARTPMARLPWLIRTHFLVPMEFFR